MTGSNFVEITSTVLEGSTVTSAPSVVAVMPGSAEEIEQGSGGVTLDRLTVDLGLTTIPGAGSGHHLRPTGKILGNYAKNGAAVYSSTGTTPVSVDLTNLATGAASSAGDAGFSTGYAVVFRNLSSSDMTIAPGGSNPSSIPKFTGTSPTIALPANSVVAYHVAAGVTIDSTHKIVTVTPTSGGNFSISVGGA